MVWPDLLYPGAIYVQVEIASELKGDQLIEHPVSTTCVSRVL